MREKEKKRKKERWRGRERARKKKKTIFVHLSAPRRACRGASRGPPGPRRALRRGAARTGPLPGAGAAAAAAALALALLRRRRRRRQPLPAASAAPLLRACAWAAVSAAACSGSSEGAAAWWDPAACPWGSRRRAGACFFRAAVGETVVVLWKREKKRRPTLTSVSMPSRFGRGSTPIRAGIRASISPAGFRNPAFTPLEGDRNEECFFLSDRKVRSERATRHGRLRGFPWQNRVPATAAANEGRFPLPFLANSSSPLQSREALSMPFSARAASAIPLFIRCTKEKTKNIRPLRLRGSAGPSPPVTLRADDLTLALRAHWLAPFSLSLTLARDTGEAS